MTLFREAAAAAGGRGAGDAGRGGPPSASVQPAAAASLALRARSRSTHTSPRGPAAINARSVAAPRYKGAAVRVSPGWGVSSPGEGLPPRRRGAGDSGARSPLARAVPRQRPGVGGLQGAGSLRPPLSARPPPGAWQRVCGAWAPGALGRAQRGSARAAPRGPCACAGQGPVPKRAPAPPLPRLYGPSSQTLDVPLDLDRQRGSATPHRSDIRPLTSRPPPGVRCTPLGAVILTHTA